MGKPNPQNLIPAKKGEVRNPNGRPATKKVDEVFREFVYQMAKNSNGEQKERLQRIIESQYLAAVKGDTRAAEFIMNRAFGKVKESVELSGKDGSPIAFYLPEKKKNDE